MDTSWKLIFDESTKSWIGYCKSLKLESRGDSLDQVISNCKSLLKELSNTQEFSKQLEMERN